MEYYSHAVQIKIIGWVAINGESKIFTIKHLIENFYHASAKGRKILFAARPSSNEMFNYYGQMRWLIHGAL